MNFFFFKDAIDFVHASANVHDVIVAAYMYYNVFKNHAEHAWSDVATCTPSRLRKARGCIASYVRLLSTRIACYIKINACTFTFWLAYPYLHVYFYIRPVVFTQEKCSSSYVSESAFIYCRRHCNTTILGHTTELELPKCTGNRFIRDLR